MSVSNRELKPGDVLVTKSNEAYVYLGYYTGTPHSMYLVPDAGYLYMFIDYIGVMSQNELNKTITDHAICEDISIRLRMGIDGNAAYTKQYKRFETKLRTADLSTIQLNLQHPFGLTRLGDKKP